MDHAGVERAHVAGLSMGGFATLHFGLQHPGRALSLCVAGCGYGAEPAQRERFREDGAPQFTEVLALIGAVDTARPLADAGHEDLGVREALRLVGSK